jgi:choice-of-anchor B domain-containing protein
MDERVLGFNTRTHLIDVRNLDEPVYLGFYQHATPASDHNVYIPAGGEFQGNFAVQTNWRAGLRILNITDIPSTNWDEVAFFDTYPEGDQDGPKSGSWSSYPWFESGVIVVNDVESGLFILDPDLDDTTTIHLPIVTLSDE